MRARPLKVYGGHLHGSGFGPRGSRVIVAAHSWEEAARLVDTPLGHLKRFWSQTWNEHELATALPRPLTVFFIEDEKHWDRKAEFKEWNG